MRRKKRNNLFLGAKHKRSQESFRSDVTESTVEDEPKEDQFKKPFINRRKSVAARYVATLLEHQRRGEFGREDGPNEDNQSQNTTVPSSGLPTDNKTIDKTDIQAETKTIPKMESSLKSRGRPKKVNKQFKNIIPSSTPMVSYFPHSTSNVTISPILPTNVKRLFSENEKVQAHTNVVEDLNVSSLAKPMNQAELDCIIEHSQDNTMNVLRKHSEPRRKTETVATNTSPKIDVSSKINKIKILTNHILKPKGSTVRSVKSEAPVTKQVASKLLARKSCRRVLRKRRKTVSVETNTTPTLAQLSENIDRDIKNKSKVLGNHILNPTSSKERSVLVSPEEPVTKNVASKSLTKKSRRLSKSKNMSSTQIGKINSLKGNKEHSTQVIDSPKESEPSVTKKVASKSLTRKSFQIGDSNNISSIQYKSINSLEGNKDHSIQHVIENPKELEPPVTKKVTSKSLTSKSNTQYKSMDSFEGNNDHSIQNDIDNPKEFEPPVTKKVTSKSLTSKSNIQHKIMDSFEGNNDHSIQNDIDNPKEFEPPVTKKVTSKSLTSKSNIQHKIMDSFEGNNDHSIQNDIDNPKEFEPPVTKKVASKSLTKKSNTQYKSMDSLEGNKDHSIQHIDNPKEFEPPVIKKVASRSLTSKSNTHYKSMDSLEGNKDHSIQNNIDNPKELEPPVTKKVASKSLTKKSNTQYKSMDSLEGNKDHSIQHIDNPKEFEPPVIKKVASRSLTSKSNTHYKSMDSLEGNKDHSIQNNIDNPKEFEPPVTKKVASKSLTKKSNTQYKSMDSLEGNKDHSIQHIDNPKEFEPPVIKKVASKSLTSKSNTQYKSMDSLEGNKDHSIQHIDIPKEFEPPVIKKVASKSLTRKSNTQYTSMESLEGNKNNSIQQTPTNPKRSFSLDRTKHSTNERNWFDKLKQPKKNVKSETTAVNIETVVSHQTNCNASNKEISSIKSASMRASPKNQSVHQRKSHNEHKNAGTVTHNYISREEIACQKKRDNKLTGMTCQNTASSMRLQKETSPVRDKHTSTIGEQISICNESSVTYSPNRRHILSEAVDWNPHVVMHSDKGVEKLQTYMKSKKAVEKVDSKYDQLQKKSQKESRKSIVKHILSDFDMYSESSSASDISFDTRINRFHLKMKQHFDGFEEHEPIKKNALNSQQDTANTDTLGKKGSSKSNNPHKNLINPEMHHTPKTPKLFDATGDSSKMSSLRIYDENKKELTKGKTQQNMLRKKESITELDNAGGLFEEASSRNQSVQGKKRTFDEEVESQTTRSSARIRRKRNKTPKKRMQYSMDSLALDSLNNEIDISLEKTKIAPSSKLSVKLSLKNSGKCSSNGITMDLEDSTLTSKRLYNREDNKQSLPNEAISSTIISKQQINTTEHYLDGNTEVEYVKPYEIIEKIHAKKRGRPKKNVEDSMLSSKHLYNREDKNQSLPNEAVSSTIISQQQITNITEHDLDGSTERENVKPYENIEKISTKKRGKPKKNVELVSRIEPKKSDGKQMEIKSNENNVDMPKRLPTSGKTKTSAYKLINNNEMASNSGLSGIHQIEKEKKESLRRAIDKRKTKLLHEQVLDMLKNTNIQENEVSTTQSISASGRPVRNRKPPQTYIPLIGTYVITYEKSTTKKNTTKGRPKKADQNGTDDKQIPKESKNKENQPNLTETQFPESSEIIEVFKKPKPPVKSRKNKKQTATTEKEGTVISLDSPKRISTSRTYQQSSSNDLHLQKLSHPRIYHADATNETPVSSVPTKTQVQNTGNHLNLDSGMFSQMSRSFNQESNVEENVIGDISIANTQSHNTGNGIMEKQSNLTTNSTSRLSTNNKRVSFALKGGRISKPYRSGTKAIAGLPNNRILFPNDRGGFDNTKWLYDKPEISYSSTVAITKDLRIGGMQNGVIEIPPLGMKESSVLKHNSMYYILLRGKVKVTMQDRTATLELHQRFYIPKGAEYAIENVCESSPAILSFCRIPVEKLLS